MAWLLPTLLIGCVCGVLLFKLRVPGGMMVGAVAGVAAFNLLTGHGYMFPYAKVVAQCITGTYIGCMVGRREVRQVPNIILPLLIVLAGLFAMNVAVAVIFCSITDLDLLTSLFCAMPGGISDVPLIAMDMGADSTMVTVMQFVRMLFGLACLPSLIMLADRQMKLDEVSGGEPPEQSGGKQAQKPRLIPFLPTLCVGVLGGILGKLSGIPAGALSFAMLFTAAVNVTGLAKPMPKWLRRVAQLFSGSCIGCAVVGEQLKQLRQMPVPVLILCLAYFLNCVLLGLLISRIFHMNRKLGMLMLSPAGASEMTLIAADMGVYEPNLAISQIFRLVFVNVMFPQFYRVILHFF